MYLTRPIKPFTFRECSLGPKIKGRAIPLPEIALAVPQVHTFEELKDNAISMFQLLGPYIYIDPVLLSKLVRICKSALSKVIFCSSCCKYHFSAMLILYQHYVVFSLDWMARNLLANQPPCTMK